jgi:nucleotide-binding universal stress UspA family protein
MGTMELVVATDLSPASTPAVDHALQWAQKLGASVTLLHVVHDPELAPALATDVPGDVANAKRALDAFAAQSAVACRVDVRTADDVASAITEAARGSDYLFVGTHGRSGFQRLRLGSIATRVLRQSTAPVVCVPSPATA